MKAPKMSLLAVAVAALLSSQAVLAQSDDVNFEGTVKLDKKDRVNVKGTIQVDSASQASVWDSQSNFGNAVWNQETENKAEIKDGSASSMSGNIGINVAAGDNNQQANAAALAAADASFVFGVAEAEVGADQAVGSTLTTNIGTLNQARAMDSLSGLTGNIGINIAAGNSNQQKNDMAAATATASFSSASTMVSQSSEGNVTFNYATDPVYENIESRMSLDMSLSGTYNGSSDQQGDLYPDIWDGDGHPAGGLLGHVDLDSQAQGAIDSNQDGGALHFNEAGDITLSGTAVGYTSIPVLVGFDNPVQNMASLSNALTDVTGNIGVNIAAGTGNQQYNGLAISSSCNACGSGNNGGE